MSRKFFLIGFLCSFLILLGIFGFDFLVDQGWVSPVSSGSLNKITEKKRIDYNPYNFEVLAGRSFEAGEIKIGRVLRREKNYTSYVFTYKSEGKTISGMANIPNKKGTFPVIVLIHGWADKENYYPGYGTVTSANGLAENGFLTLSPDFSGYGTSDSEDSNILIARFSKPIEIINLLSAIGSLPPADSGRIGFWAHSNGGQIALSVLEITGKDYPTSLWAPVSLDFPECVLTYLGTAEVGNIVKERVDEFLTYNDPKKYSIRPYLDRLKSPFIVHQATNDTEIKQEWTESLVEELKKRNLEVSFYIYPNENHNFNRYKTTGDVLRQRDLEFFKEQLAN